MAPRSCSQRLALSPRRSLWASMRATRDSVGLCGPVQSKPVGWTLWRALVTRSRRAVGADAGGRRAELGALQARTGCVTLGSSDAGSGLPFWTFRHSAPSLLRGTQSIARDHVVRVISLSCGCAGPGRKSAELTCSNAGAATIERKRLVVRKQNLRDVRRSAGATVHRT